MKNKTALVTGATSGIGFELANILASQGFDLVLVARNVDKLIEIKNDFEKKYYVKCLNIPGDLSSPNFPPVIYDVLFKQKINVDVLVNNAGFGDWGFFAESVWKKQEEMVQVNVTALMHLTRLFLPSMIERKSGRILNISSTAAFQPGPLMSVYYAGKSFVLSFSEAVANELQGTGVSVTALCPGPTRSNFQAAARIEHLRLFTGRQIPSSRVVAEYGFKAMMEGRPVAIHGTMNKVIAFGVRFLPRRWVLSIARKLQEERR